MHWKERVIKGAREGEVGVGVVGFPVEAGVRMQVGVGAEGGVSVEATRRHRTQALDMYRVAHRILFRDHLSIHAVYHQIIWTQNLPIDVKSYDFFTSKPCSFQTGNCSASCLQ